MYTQVAKVSIFTILIEKIGYITIENQAIIIKKFIIKLGIFKIVMKRLGFFMILIVSMNQERKKKQGKMNHTIAMMIVEVIIVKF